MDGLLEVCDVRLTTTSYTESEESTWDLDTPRVKALPSSDVAFFRLGFYNDIGLNHEYMLETYEGDKWYSVDLVIDWANEPVPDKYHNLNFISPQT